MLANKTKTEKRIIILLVVVFIVNIFNLIISYGVMFYYGELLFIFIFSLIIEILIFAVLILMIRKE